MQAQADHAAQEPVSGSRAVARFSLLIAVVALASKPLALLRDAAIGASFGAGAATDALFLALAVPNAAVAVIAGGGLRVAFQPELTRRFADAPRDAWRYATSLFVAVTVVGVLGSLGIAVLARPLATLLGGDGGETLPRLLRLVSPMLLLFGWTTVLFGVLHVRLRFFWPAAEPVVRNTVVIVTVLGLSWMGVEAAVHGWVLGTLAVTVACGAAVRRAGFVWVRPEREDLGALRALLLASVSATVGAATFPLVSLAGRSMATWLEPGAASTLAYAEPLLQAGQVFAMSVSTAALPVLTRLDVRAAAEEFATTLRHAVRGAVFLTAPVAALLAALAEPVIRVLYMRGRFGPEEVRATAGVVEWFAVALLPMAGFVVLMRAYQARGRFAETARIGLMVLAANLVQNVVLMRLLGSRGLALSVALSALLYVLLLDRGLALRSPGRLSFVVRLSVATVGCFLSAWLVSSVLPPVAEGVSDALARVVVGSLAGLVAFAALAFVLRMEESRAAARYLLRRLRR